MAISCSSSHVSPKIEKPTSLAEVTFQKCLETPRVSDGKTEFNQLRDLNWLSFSQAYHRFHINYDSLSIRPTRLANQELIHSTVQLSFPNIKVVPSSRLKNMRYTDQMLASSKIKWNDRDSSDIQKLSEKGNGNKQLYIEVVTYGAQNPNNPHWENRVSIFVFDLKFSRLLYLNEFQYNCDPRDTLALQKVIQYGFNQMKGELKQ